MRGHTTMPGILNSHVGITAQLIKFECFLEQMYCIKIIFYVWWVVMKLWRNSGGLPFIIKITGDGLSFSQE